MKKLLIMLIVVGMSAGVASAAGGVGVFGSYWDADDPGPGYGGGLKFKAELVDYLAVELRASCITKFDEWDGDDDLFVIPLEAGLVLNFPLGTEVPITTTAVAASAMPSSPKRMTSTLTMTSPSTASREPNSPWAMRSRSLRKPSTAFSR